MFQQNVVVFVAALNVLTVLVMLTAQVWACTAEEANNSGKAKHSTNETRNTLEKTMIDSSKNDDNGDNIFGFLVLVRVIAVRTDWWSRHS
jgi:hypothetical protein